MSDILSRLAPPPGSRKTKKRLGRGPGSGLGKTSGKGGKGQTARAGGNPRRGFEGGQMPIHRRLPKRGFKNPFRVEYAVVNLQALEGFDNDMTIDPELLHSAGLIDRMCDGVKILGKGEFTKKLTVRAHAISASAKEKIEKAGGIFEELPRGR
ncbi:MAG: 50S ribosomal protein L15 [Myxococcota bacterium]|jgi:large subunit ribosomal protein L15|nr:50S ribosomal protein L15 [Myxococcota bacterium]